MASNGSHEEGLSEQGVGEQGVDKKIVRKGERRKERKLSGNYTGKLPSRLSGSLSTMGTKWSLGIPGEKCPHLTLANTTTTPPKAKNPLYYTLHDPPSRSPH
ncbi:hypothetical protein Pmani_037942 [Petrolisthes manimaculis]|uniref:Uncharacterized protein n=1 Tax=Petrolisthes manimaculis TaxID=1843537 RepID=A0AAE1NHC9_9EUCA|nr:hypothetical protein Pmani_037942 [Petrolisthes manimaculis]